MPIRRAGPLPRRGGTQLTVGKPRRRTTGANNYRDFYYLPSPGNDCNITGALLSGGAGKLTDGVSPVNSWFNDGANTEWNGWAADQGQLDLTVRFHFSSIVNVGSVTVWVDNSFGSGSVNPPG